MSTSIIGYYLNGSEVYMEDICILSIIIDMQGDQGSFSDRLQTPYIILR